MMHSYSGSRPAHTYPNGKSHDLMLQRVQEASDRDGNKLSPVDLTLSNAKELQLPPLNWTHYRTTPTTMTVRNSGFTVMINANFNQETPYVSSGPLSGNYNFSQIHFHWGEHNETGSAHAVNGVRYPLEMHVVHLKKECANLGEAFQSKDGIAVMVHLFALQEERNPQLDQLTAILQFIQKPKSCARLYPTPLAEIIHPFSSDYYMYWGAVGSPKGQYRILWLISRTVLPVSPQQLEEFRQLQDPQGKLLNSNSSKPHPLAGRTLFIVSPEDINNEEMYGISRNVNQSLTTLESEEIYDIGNAEYKSLAAFDEIEDCKVCMPSKNIKQNIHVGHPYRVNEGDTSIEESCIDLANNTDSSGVTIHTEMNTNGKKVIANVNVTRHKHRPMNYSPSEAVYSVISTKGSELHLRRRPMNVRQSDRSTEQACMLLSNSVPLSPSFSAPSLSTSHLDHKQEYVELSYPQTSILHSEPPGHNIYTNPIDYSGENYNSKYGYRKLPEPLSKSYSVKVKDIPGSQCVRQDPKLFSWDKHDTSNQDDNQYFNRFQSGRNNYEEFSSEVKDVTESTRRQKYIFVKQTQQNKPACYGSKDPPKEFNVQPIEIDQSKFMTPSNKQRYSKNQYIIDDTSINQLNNKNPKQIKKQDRDYNERQYMNTKKVIQEFNGTKDYPQNVNIDKSNKEDLLSVHYPFPSSLPSKEPQKLEKSSHRKQPVKPTGKASYRPQRDSAKSDSCYKVSLLVRTTVSDHTRPGKKKGIAKQYVVTKISPVEKSIIVMPSDINNGEKNGPVNIKGIADTESLYYAKPLMDPELDPELEMEIQDNTTRNEQNRYNIGYENDPSDNVLTEKVKEVRLMNSDEGKGETYEVRDGNVTVRVNEKIVPNEDRSADSPPKRINQYIINEEFQEEVTEFNSIQTRHKVVINSQKQDKHIKETSSNHILNTQLENEMSDKLENQSKSQYKKPTNKPLDNQSTNQREKESNKKIDSQSINQCEKEINNKINKQSTLVSNDPVKDRKSQQQVNMHNERLNDPDEEFHVEEKTKTRINDKDELTDMVLIVKQSRVADPKKIEDRKEINYDIIKSKHPAPQFYMKEPFNKSQPPVLIKQNEALDQQIKGHSQIKQTVEYSDDKQPKDNVNYKSPDNCDNLLYSNVTETYENVTEEQTSTVKTLQQKTYLNVKPNTHQNDPEISSLNNEKTAIKTCRTFTHLPELLKENTSRKIDQSNDPSINHISDLKEYEPEKLIATSEIEEPLKYEQKINQIPQNTENRVLKEDNSYNQPQIINTTVEYEEVIEENTFTSQETKQHLKSTLKSGDRAFQFPIKNTAKLNEASSMNLITLRKIEIPEPHYVTRVPKQPLIEYEAYPVDPHQPFEIMTETFEEMTSIVKTNKTFMMFKKINGKAVLNQPSIIEPMKLETENNLNSQPGTKNNSFARSRTEGVLQSQPRQNISENMRTTKTNDKVNNLKSEKTYMYNDPSKTQNNRTENIVKSGEYIKGLTKLDSVRGPTHIEEVPKQVNLTKDTDPPVNTFDPGNGFSVYNYSETSIVSKLQKTQQQNKYRYQKTSAFQEPSPVEDIPRKTLKPENIPLDCDKENDILEEQTIEENKSVQNSTKVVKSSYKYSKHKLASQQPSNTLGSTLQQEHKQIDFPQRNYQDPITYTTMEEYYESNIEDYKNVSTQRHFVVTSKNPTTKSGNVLSTRKYPEAIFGQGFLDSGKKPNENGITEAERQHPDDRTDKQLEITHKHNKSHQKYPSQKIVTDEKNQPEELLNKSPQDRTEGDIVIYIRQPNSNDDHISPRITVDVGETFKMTESELDAQKVKVYETKKSTRGTEISRNPIFPRKSKSEQYPRSNRFDDKIDTESSEEQCIDTTHYNSTLKSITTVELPNDKKRSGKSRIIIVDPTSNNNAAKKSVTTVKSKAEQCCSGVAIEEVAEEIDTNEYTSFEEEVVSETSFNQSPIKIQTDSAKRRPLPMISFFNHWDAKGDALLENNGKTLRVTYLEKNHPPYIIGGPLNDVYMFYELHFHWGYKDCCGAEHIVDGQRNSIEAHFLYIKKEYKDLKEAVQHTDGVAILAISLNVGNPPNEQLENLIKDMPLLREADTGTYVASEYMFAWIKPSIESAKGYYSYRGSLAPEPPHVEAVTWMVFPEPIPFCCQQSSEFRKLKSSKGELLMKNFRPPQPLNNRTVYFVPIS